MYVSNNNFSAEFLSPLYVIGDNISIIKCGVHGKEAF